MALYVIETCHFKCGPCVSLLKGKPHVVLIREPKALAELPQNTAIALGIQNVESRSDTGRIRVLHFGADRTQVSRLGTEIHV